MLNYDYTKEYSLPIDTSLKTMRIRLSPSIELENENMYVVDMLEESGVFRIMEHIDNTLCMPTDAEQADTANAVFLAEIKVSVLPERKDLRVESIIHLYGYDDLDHILMQKVLFFADFYGYKVSILNLKKKQRSYSKKTSIAAGR